MNKSCVWGAGRLSCYKNQMIKYSAQHLGHNMCPTHTVPNCQHPPCPTHRPSPLREPLDSTAVRRQKTALVPMRVVALKLFFFPRSVSAAPPKARLCDLVKWKTTEGAEQRPETCWGGGARLLAFGGSMRRIFPGKTAHQGQGH